MRPSFARRPVDEEVDDVVLREVAGGELLVVPPQPFAELGDRRPRQQQPAALVLEGVFDVPDRKPARQHLDRQILERLGVPLQMIADLGAKRRRPAGDLGHRIVDQAFRRLQTPVTDAVAVAALRVAASPF